MKRTAARLLGIVFILGILRGPAAESAYLSSRFSPFETPVSLNAWVANFRPGAAAYALKHYAPHLQEISVFGVGGYSNGELAVEKEFIQATLKALKKHPHPPRVLLTVANNRRGRVGDRRLLRQWFGTSEKSREHIADLVKLVDNVDGLDIDYENLYPSDGPEFSLFLVQLAQALHGRGKYLSVTVEPNALLYGSINWADLSTRVDRIRIMAYPFHYKRTRPGAVSPPATVRRLAERALKFIPAEKLEIALAMYGFDWSSKNVNLVSRIGQYQQLARRPGAKAFRDPQTQCARVEYTVTETTRHKKNNRTQNIAHHVWFEDPASVAYKVQMLQQMGVVHVGLWQLAVGDITPLFDHVQIDLAASK